MKFFQSLSFLVFSILISFYANSQEEDFYSKVDTIIQCDPNITYSDSSIQCRTIIKKRRHLAYSKFGVFINPLNFNKYNRVRHLISLSFSREVNNQFEFGILPSFNVVKYDGLQGYLNIYTAFHGFSKSKIQPTIGASAGINFQGKHYSSTRPFDSSLWIGLITGNEINKFQIQLYINSDESSNFISYEFRDYAPIGIRVGYSYNFKKKSKSNWLKKLKEYEADYKRHESNFKIK